jgi:hypothetical protein
MAALKKENLSSPKADRLLHRSATPQQWRKYIKQGINDWQAAFEAWFKNAIIAKDAPH